VAPDGGWRQTGGSCRRQRWGKRGEEGGSALRWVLAVAPPDGVMAAVLETATGNDVSNREIESVLGVIFVKMPEGGGRA
jgi:hypothetical protein